MRDLRYLLIVSVCVFGLFTFEVPSAKAQVRFGVGIGVGPAYGGYYSYGGNPYYDPDYDSGPPPDCLYGYYSYYPYACAPYGYWGPDYFYDGVFVGAGPWFGWGFGPGFRARFHDFDDFHRWGGFRGDRFRDFRNEGGLRGWRGGDSYRGGYRGFGGSGLRGVAPGGNGYRAFGNSGGFHSGAAPNRGSGFRSAAPRGGSSRGGFGGGGFHGGAHGGGGGFRGGSGGGHGGGHR